MNHTPNYQLSQWEAGDQVLRADFNADNAKLDGALGALAARTGGLEQSVAGVVTLGSYGASATEKRTVQLPFAPKLLLLFGEVLDESAMGFVTQDFAYLTVGGNTFQNTGVYAPLLNGSTLTLNIWFNKGTTSYIAFR